MPTEVAVMGAGSWGTAFAMVCCDAGSRVRLWARRPEVAEAIDAERRHPDYLGGVELPEQLQATADAQQALSAADLVVLAVPSHALAGVLRGWRDLVPREATYVSLIKGVELATRRRASQVVRGELDLPHSQVTVVSGPNIAGECAARLPAATVAAGAESAKVERVQQACHSPWMRVYTNPDVVGVELGGAVKNAIAIAAGIADGMGLGDNAKATIVTRGLAELTRLVVACGGNPLTCSGLAGVGDLVVTCTSRGSRNRHVGEQLGAGRGIDEITGEMSMVAEGVRSCGAIMEMARERGVDMPIVEHVEHAVAGRMTAEQLVESLMRRSPKSELHGLEGIV